MTYVGKIMPNSYHQGYNDAEKKFIEFLNDSILEDDLYNRLKNKIKELKQSLEVKE